jgi:hypothetical protein
MVIYLLFRDSILRESFKTEMEFFKSIPGTDDMIFKIFSPKNSAKKFAFLTENKANFFENDHNIVF